MVDAVRSKMIETFTKISQEAAEKFTNLQQQLDEAKKIR